MSSVWFVVLLLSPAFICAAPFSQDMEGGTVVDLNNPDPEILRQYNINMSEFLNRQAAYRASKGLKPLPTTASSSSDYASDQPSLVTPLPSLARNESGLDIVAINRQ